jgi:hypothetical protein
MGNGNNWMTRRILIIGIMLVIAAFHIIRPGSYLHGDLFRLYYAYFSDIALPFGLYFLLFLPEPQTPALRRWEVKFAFAFIFPSILEILQYFGIPALGTVFDWFDFLCYLFGSLLAVIVDKQVFSRIFDFWKSKPKL